MSEWIDPPKRDCILTEAKQITSVDRQDDYGHPYHNFGNVAAAASAIIGKRLVAEDIISIMILIKLSREQNRHKRDNLVDIAGYARVMEMVKTYEDSQA